MSSAKGLAEWYSPYEVGTGRLDVAAAVRNAVSSTGSLFFGNYDWPHEQTDVAVVKDLVLTNHGSVDITINLALTNTGGPFSLGASTVVVPAGGKAAVTVTGDPRAVEFGRFTGYIVGTDAVSGQPVTRTSVALIKEDERYNLNINVIGRDGKPAAGWVFINLAGDFWPWALYVDGSHTMRMMPGTYTVGVYLDVAGEKADRSGLAVIVDPETVLNGASADVVLDASKARLLQTEAPQRTEDRQRKVDFNVHYNGMDPFLDFRSAYVLPSMYDDIYVSPTDEMTQGQFMLTTRWRKGEPMLGLGVDGSQLTFDTLVQPGSTLLEATSDKLHTVFAGNGTAADYESVTAKGKIVVVERSDEVSPQERAEAAAAAGAKVLIVVNDRIGGLMEYVGESPIAVATVHRDAGEDLIAMAKLGEKLTVTQSKYSDFVYDLSRDYPGRVPDEALVYKPSQEDLAKIDARYYGVNDGEASGYRYDLTLTPSLGFHEREWHPSTRFEWVTAGQVWVESHAQNIYGELPWEMVSGVNTYPGGATTRLDWFAPAIGPGFSDSFGVYNSRWQDYMTWNVQAWSSSSDVMRLGGYLPWGMTPTHLQVFQGDNLIHDNPFSADMQWKEVPAGNLPYRVVLDAQRPGDVFRLSTSTHSEWTFMSDTVDAEFFEPFSVLELDYKLETDLRGQIEQNKDPSDRAAPAVVRLRNPARQRHLRDARGLLRRRRHLADRVSGRGRHRLVDRRVPCRGQGRRVPVGACQRHHGQRLQHQTGDHQGVRPAMTRNSGPRVLSPSGARSARRGQLRTTQSLKLAAYSPSCRLWRGDSADAGRAGARACRRGDLSCVAETALCHRDTNGRAARGLRTRRR